MDVKNFPLMPLVKLRSENAVNKTNVSFLTLKLLAT